VRITEKAESEMEGGLTVIAKNAAGQFKILLLELCAR
jgi:hypothetical protein